MFLHVLLSDRLGRLHSTKKPDTIISLVPSWTEFIVEIVGVKKLIGRTDFCIFPNEVKKVTSIGGTKNPDIAAIVELQPDLVVANKEENKQFDINRLRGNGIEVMMTSAITPIEAVEEMAIFERKLLGKLSLSSEISQNIEMIQQEKSFSFLYLVWFDPIMVAGRSTYISNVIELAGGRNICSAQSSTRYPNLSFDEIRGKRPNYIFLPDEPYQFTEQHREKIADITRAEQVMLIDGKLASWYGKRLIDALDFFQSLQSGD